MSVDIRSGDIGHVQGRDGLYMVISGAPMPENIHPVSVSAQEAAEMSEALGLDDGSFCLREEWRPL